MPVHTPRYANFVLFVRLFVRTRRHTGIPSCGMLMLGRVAYRRLQLIALNLVVDARLLSCPSAQPRLINNPTTVFVFPGFPTERSNGTTPA